MFQIPMVSIPDNWKIERLDRLFQLRNEPARIDDPPVSAFIDGTVTLRSNRPDAIIKGSGQEIGYKHIEIGDLVISGMNAHLGGLGISDSSGKCTPVYTVMEKTIDLESRFISYYLLHAAKSGYIKSLVNAVRYNSADFGPETIKRFMVPVPPLEEQIRIANFLDAQISRIDNVINYKIQQKDIISREVQARLTDFFGHPYFSGLQVNGSRRLGPCLLVNEGGYWGEDPIGSNDTLVLRSTEITSRGKWRDLENGAYRNLNLENNKRHLLKFDDILVTKASGSLEHIGKAALVTQEIVDLEASFGNFMQRLRVNQSLYLPSYICHFLRSSNARSQFQYWGTTSTGLFNISAELLNNLQVPVVSLDEQERISAIIEDLETDFEARMALIEKSIALFEELKFSTIAEAVVGNLNSHTLNGVYNV